MYNSRKQSLHIGFNKFLALLPGIDQSISSSIDINLARTHTHKMVFNKFLELLPEIDQSVSSNSDKNLAHTHTHTHTHS